MRRAAAVLFWVAVAVTAFEWVVRPLVRMMAAVDDGPWM